jgi:hypothetical protein
MKTERLLCPDCFKFQEIFDPSGGVRPKFTVTFITCPGCFVGSPEASWRKDSADLRRYAYRLWIHSLGAQGEPRRRFQLVAKRAAAAADQLELLEGGLPAGAQPLTLNSHP